MLPDTQPHDHPAHRCPVKGVCAQTRLQQAGGGQTLKPGSSKMLNRKLLCCYTNALWLYVFKWENLSVYSEPGKCTLNRFIRSLCNHKFAALVAAVWSLHLFSHFTDTTSDQMMTNSTQRVCFQKRRVKCRVVKAKFLPPSSLLDWPNVIFETRISHESTCQHIDCERIREQLY